MEYVPDRFKDYLSEREIRELEFFFTDLRRTGFRNSYNDYDCWNEIDSREELQERISEIKKMHDEASHLAEKKPEVFSRQWREAAVEDTVNGQAGKQERVCSCVYHRMNPNAEPPKWANSPFWGAEFGGKPNVLRKAEDRGNPSYKQEVPYREIIKTAERLLDEEGATAYRVRHGKYSTTLCDDVGGEVGVSRSTVRRAFEQSSFEMPLACSI